AARQRGIREAHRSVASSADHEDHPRDRARLPRHRPLRDAPHRPEPGRDGGHARDTGLLLARRVHRRGRPGRHPAVPAAQPSPRPGVTTVPVGATPVYLVAENCHPQTIAVLQTRAGARGLKVQVADPARFRFTPGVIGALVQYPTTDGAIAEYAGVCAAAHAAGALVTAATDLLALTLLPPPGEWGADIA